MSMGKQGGGEDRQSTDFEAFGKSVVEEVLFRAGLDAADAGIKVEKALTALQFQISAIEADGALEVEFDRVGSSSFKLQIKL